MILEDETFEVYGYCPSELLLQSHKLILVMCKVCGEFRVVQRRDYRSFSQSCSHILGEKLKGKNNPNFHKFGRDSHTFGRRHTDEEKALMSALAKGKYEGEKNPFFGKIHMKETKAKISAAAKERIGEKNPNYKGGRRVSEARRKAKRTRELGFKMLLPLKEDGEVWHHVTNEYVIGILKEIHEKCSGNRQKHRAKVLEWLKANNREKYVKVLDILKGEEK